MTMSRVEASVEVDAPLEKVWAYASDWSRWEEWWHGVSDFRPTTEVSRGNGTRSFAGVAGLASVTAMTNVHKVTPASTARPGAVAVHLIAFPPAAAHPVPCENESAALIVVAPRTWPSLPSCQPLSCEVVRNHLP